MLWSGVLPEEGEGEAFESIEYIASYVQKHDEAVSFLKSAENSNHGSRTVRQISAMFLNSRIESDRMKIDLVEAKIRGGVLWQR